MSDIDIHVLIILLEMSLFLLDKDSAEHVLEGLEHVFLVEVFSYCLHFYQSFNQKGWNVSFYDVLLSFIGSEEILTQVVTMFLPF